MALGPSPREPYEDGSLRRYRSECIIVNDMLSIIEKHGNRGIKKTPLMNRMNMNSNSFKVYKAMLENAGLVERRKEDARGEVLVITGAGKLTLNIMEMLSCVYNAKRHIARMYAEKYADLLARHHGWVKEKDTELVDYVLVSPNGSRLGVLGAACDSKSVVKLAKLVKGLAELNNIALDKLVIVNVPEDGELGYVPEPLVVDGYAVIVSSGASDDGEEVGKKLAELVAAGARA